MLARPTGRGLDKTSKQKTQQDLQLKKSKERRYSSEGEKTEQGAPTLNTDG